MPPRGMPNSARRPAIARNDPRLSRTPSHKFSNNNNNNSYHLLSSHSLSFEIYPYSLLVRPSFTASIASLSIPRPPTSIRALLQNYYDDAALPQIHSASCSDNCTGFGARWHSHLELRRQMELANLNKIMQLIRDNRRNG